MTSYDDSFLISYWSASVTALSSDWLKGVMNILARDIDTPGESVTRPGQLRQDGGQTEHFYTQQVPWRYFRLQSGI